MFLLFEHGALAGAVVPVLLGVFYLSALVRLGAVTLSRIVLCCMATGSAAVLGHSATRWGWDYDWFQGLRSGFKPLLLGAVALLAWNWVVVPPPLWWEGTVMAGVPVAVGLVALALGRAAFVAHEAELQRREKEARRYEAEQNEQARIRDAREAELAERTRMADEAARARRMKEAEEEAERRRQREEQQAGELRNQRRIEQEEQDALQRAKAADGAEEYRTIRGRRYTDIGERL
jgi:flagellar biosynthesis GTPase FlhF